MSPTAGDGTGNRAGEPASGGAAGGGNEAGVGGDAAGGSPSGGEGGGAEPSAWEVDAPTVSVTNGTEETLCAVVDLGNTRPIRAGELHVTTSDAVFELRVGAVSDGTTSGPSACTPFGDLGDPAVKPLLFTRARSEDIVFPTGVAYTLAKHQLLRFEIHALNPAAPMLDALAHLRVVEIPDAAYEKEAGLLLLSNHDFDIAAAATLVEKAYFPASSGIGDASIVRAVGNVHAAGTRVVMSTASAKTGPFSSFYDPLWSDAPTPADIQPPVNAPSGGGVELECDWNNTTNAELLDGAGSHAERCMGFLYHAPAVEPRACIQVTNVVFCCPPGESSCNGL